MGASLFKPECSPPVFQMASVEVAGECGHWNGMVWAIVLSIIVLIIGVITFKNQSAGEVKTYTSNGEIRTIKTKGKKKYWILGVTGGIILLLLVVFPTISGWSNKQKFRGAQVQLANLKSRGMTEQQANIQMQRLYEQKMRAGATSSGATNIALALLASK